MCAWSLGLNQQSSLFQAMACHQKKKPFEYIIVIALYSVYIICKNCCNSNTNALELLLSLQQHPHFSATILHSSSHLSLLYLLDTLITWRPPGATRPETSYIFISKDSHDAYFCLYSFICGYFYSPGGHLNIKMLSYQYRDPHVKDNTV